MKGTARITLGNLDLEKKAGENIFIPTETRHRIQNNSSEPLTFIEVQVGETLDENDIVRYEDKYGRV